LKEYYIITPIV